jgi:endogenous inhibitor of DNA gyrase (YacG/DUF329 family)
MRPADLDRLKDEMCIRLLEATSSDTALQRARLEIDVGYPVYDPDPTSNVRGLQPRDLLKRCGSCGCLIVVVGTGAEKRFCSARCRLRDHDARIRAERIAAAAEGVA